MRIYKKHDLERIACDRIIEDYKADVGYNFTNTSYGCGGECLCSIENKQTKMVEKSIHYCLDQRYFYDNTARLVKYTRVMDWTKKPREERETETKETILELYPMGRSTTTVYTDDKDYADKADAVRLARSRRPSGDHCGWSYNHKNFSRCLELGTEEYNKAKEFIQNRKYIRLKKNATIFLFGELIKNDNGKFERAYTGYKYEYRNEMNYVRKNTMYPD